MKDRYREKEATGHVSASCVQSIGRKAVGGCLLAVDNVSVPYYGATTPIASHRFQSDSNNISSTVFHSVLPSMTCLPMSTFCRLHIGSPVGLPPLLPLAEGFFFGSM
ncbi:unnamed protein product [Lactuca virosa]|uniref:Uncharacterized protein n=1 Tax=Lactuca virosa TaxID=75947 RepID=A0AAU9MPG1_9ASTR|nr:unnamed protein product [Lactuca virosa]